MERSAGLSAPVPPHPERSRQEIGKRRAGKKTRPDTDCYRWELCIALSFSLGSNNGALPSGAPGRGRKVRINTGCGWMRKPACHVLAFAPGRLVPAGAVGHTGRTASEGREVQQLGICETGGAGSCCAERLNTL